MRSSSLFGHLTTLEPTSLRVLLSVPVERLVGWPAPGRRARVTCFRSGQVTPPGASGSYVTGIQRGGFLLSGKYSDAVTSNVHGYVWDLLHPSNFAPIDPDPNGVLDTEVADMNPAGNLAGWFSDLSGVGHGYILINDGLTSFALPGASSTAAYGISPSGDLVGTYCDSSICHAYLLRGGISGALTTIDVPAPGVVETDAYGINPLGQIVGAY